MVETDLEDISQEQSLVMRLAFALGIVSLIALLSTGAAVWLFLTARTHFVTAGMAGDSRPGEIADTFVYNYVERCLFLRYTWSYLDIAQAHQQFKGCLHPEQLAHLDKDMGVFKTEAKLAKQYDMSSGLVILEQTILQRVGLQRQVRVRALRHRWVGGTPDHDDLTIYLILKPLLEHGQAKDLRVWQISDDQPLKVTGQASSQR